MTFCSYPIKPHKPYLKYSDLFVVARYDEIHIVVYHFQEDAKQLVRLRLAKSDLCIFGFIGL